MKKIMHRNVFGIEIPGELIAHWGKTCHVRLGERCYEVETASVTIL